MNYVHIISEIYFLEKKKCNLLLMLHCLRPIILYYLLLNPILDYILPFHLSLLPTLFYDYRLQTISSIKLFKMIKGLFILFYFYF